MTIWYDPADWVTGGDANSWTVRRKTDEERAADYAAVMATGNLRPLDDPPPPCVHAEHDPPTMVVLPNGAYEWTCPGCGHEQVFRVNRSHS